MNLPRRRLHAWTLTAILAVSIPAAALVALPAAFGDEAAAGVADPPVFGTPVQVSAVPTFEPSVRVDSTGVIFVAGARGLPNPSPVFRSDDGGATWIAMDLPSFNDLGTYGLGAEPEIALAADDSLYYSELYLGNVILAKYVDHGRTLAGWTVLGQTTTGVDRQWIAVGEPSAAGNHEMWVNTFDIGRGVRQYYTPDALLVPATAPNSVNSNTAMSGPSVPPAYDPLSGYVYSTINDAGSFWLKRSSAAPVDVATPAMQAWRIAAVGDAANQFPSVAVDDAGSVHAAWSQDVGGGVFEVFVASSTDHGVTWSAPLRVSAGGLNVYPWMDAGSAGGVVVAWYHSDGTGNPETDEGPWRVQVAQGRDVTGSAPEVALVTLPHVVQDGHGICLSGSGCTLSPSGSRALGDYFQVAIGPDGMAHLAYSAAVNGANAKMYHVKQIAGQPT